MTPNPRAGRPGRRAPRIVPSAKRRTGKAASKRGGGAEDEGLTPDPAFFPGRRGGGARAYGERCLRVELCVAECA